MAITSVIDLQIYMSGLRRTITRYQSLSMNAFSIPTGLLWTPYLQTHASRRPQRWSQEIPSEIQVVVWEPK